MKNFTLARRYARALYELATETKTVDEVMLGMSNVSHAIDGTPELAEALRNPLLKPDEKEGLIKSITSNKIILKLITLLAKRKRLELFSLVSEELRQFSDRDRGLHRVLIRTTNQLSEAHKKLIELALARNLGGTVQGKFEIAKELIGGMWIKVGDRVLDASLKGRIEDLRFVLTHSAN